jgi:hypothetical protein
MIDILASQILAHIEKSAIDLDFQPQTSDRQVSVVLKALNLQPEI